MPFEKNRLNNVITVFPSLEDKQLTVPVTLGQQMSLSSKQGDPKTGEFKGQDQIIEPHCANKQMQVPAIVAANIRFALQIRLDVTAA